MPFPTISPLPQAPYRGDPEATFTQRANAFVAALPTFRDEINALAEQLNTDAPLLDFNAKAALAAANYKGIWSTLSGALNIPASVYHNGKIYMLKQSVTAVQNENPETSDKWALLFSEENLSNNPSMFMAVGADIPQNSFVVAHDDGVTMSLAKCFSEQQTGWQASVMDATYTSKFFYSCYSDLADSKIKVKNETTGQILTLENTTAQRIMAYALNDDYVIFQYVTALGACKLVVISTASFTVSTSITQLSSGAVNCDLLVTGNNIFATVVTLSETRVYLYTGHTLNSVGNSQLISGQVNAINSVALDDNRVLYFYYLNDTAYYARVARNNSNSLQLGTQATVYSSTTNNADVFVYQYQADAQVCVFNHNNNIRAVKLSTSGTSISVGSNAELVNTSHSNFCLTYYDDNQVLLTTTSTNTIKNFIVDVSAVPKAELEYQETLPSGTPVSTSRWFYGVGMNFYMIRYSSNTTFLIAKTLTSSRLVLGFCTKGCGRFKREAVITDGFVFYNHNKGSNSALFLKNDGTLDITGTIQIGRAVSNSKIELALNSANIEQIELLNYINQLYRRKLTPDLFHAIRYNIWKTREVFTSSGTFTVPNNVYYLLIACIGAGANGTTTIGGGSGGIAFKLLKVAPGQQISYTISSGVASCLGMTANPASGSTGGTASGGDFNYNGGNATNYGGAGVGSNASGGGGGGMIFISGEQGSASNQGGGGLGGMSDYPSGGGLLARNSYYNGGTGFPLRQLGIIVTNDLPSGNNSFGFKQSVYINDVGFGDKVLGRAAFGSGGTYPNEAGGFGGGGSGSSGSAGAPGGFGGGGGYSNSSSDSSGGFGGGGGGSGGSAGAPGGFGAGGGRGGATPGLGGSACVVFVY